MGREYQGSMNWVFQLLILIIQALPLGVVIRIGHLFGWLGWFLDAPHRRVVLQNLNIAFGNEHPPSWHEQVGRKSFIRFTLNALVAVWMAGRSGEQLQQHFQLAGVEENLRPALTGNRGVIHVLFHSGNWEGLARAVASIPSVRFSVIYQPLRNPHLDRLIAGWRQRGGVALINRHQGLREAVSRLRRGEAVGMLVDQHAGDHGMWVPFFGRLALTTPLPALLARRTGAPIVPVTCTTDPSLPASRISWKVEFGPPIPVKGRADGEILAAIHAHLEKVILRDPSDWFWLHDRWKTPSPNFLTDGYRRGVHAPPGTTLKPFRILVRGANWLGDSILTIPALRAIRAGRPDAHVTLLVKPWLADLWRGQSYIDKVITSVSEASTTPFDAAILLPNSFRSAFEAWNLGIPRRQGYAGHFRRQLLTAVCPESNRAGFHRHEVKDFIGLARWSGAPITEEIPRLDLPDRGTFPPHLPQPPYIVLHPGAAHGSAKRWLSRRFVELAQRFADRHWIVVGSPDEIERNAHLIASMGPLAEDWTGRLSLRELAMVLHRASAVVCNDSGPMHLAAAVGARVVAIFGSTEPLHTGPLGDGHHVLREAVDCSPCYLKECPTDLRCMKAITVDQATAALKEILTKT
jgi:lipopolysaccharide heptosyltransferase II